MVAWGVLAVLAAIVVAGTIYAGVSLHRTRSRTGASFRAARAALEKQQAEFDQMLAAAQSFGINLAELVEQVAGKIDEPNVGPGPAGPAHTDPPPTPPPTAGTGGDGDTGIQVAASVGVQRSYSPRDSQIRGHGRRESAIRRQRERQWTELNAASDASAHIGPEPTAASVFDTVSVELLAGFHGSAVGAVYRERSRIEDSPENSEWEFASEELARDLARRELGRRELASSPPDKPSRQVPKVEKSIHPAIVDPRAWERDTSFGDYGFA